MDKSVLSFKGVRPDQDFIDEIFKLDVRKLDTLDDRIVSQYAIGLSQYLIFFRAQQNEAKAEQFRIQRKLDLSINQLLTSDIVKS